MSKYKIVAEYTTGDSYDTWDTKDEVIVLDNLDDAKELLKIIKEHYEWYREVHDRWSKKKKPKRYKYCHPKYDFVIETKYGRISTNWCGYFETLNSVYITSQPEDGWRYDF